MTMHMVRRWSAVLLLAAAWLLLQQGAWRHALSHDVSHPVSLHQQPLADQTHDHAPDHPKAHGLCTLCLSLQASHAALPAAPVWLVPALAIGLARVGWVSVAHWPAPIWRPRSRAPPMTTLR